MVDQVDQVDTAFQRAWLLVPRGMVHSEASRSPRPVPLPVHRGVPVQEATSSELSARPSAWVPPPRSGGPETTKPGERRWGMTPGHHHHMAWKKRCMKKGTGWYGFWMPMAEIAGVSHAEVPDKREIRV